MRIKHEPKTRAPITRGANGRHSFSIAPTVFSAPFCLFGIRRIAPVPAIHNLLNATLPLCIRQHLSLRPKRSRYTHVEWPSLSRGQHAILSTAETGAESPFGFKGKIGGTSAEADVCKELLTVPCLPQRAALARFAGHAKSSLGRSTSCQGRIGGEIAAEERRIFRRRSPPSPQTLRRDTARE
jgi:hypothetical protein